MATVREVFEINVFGTMAVTRRRYGKNRALYELERGPSANGRHRSTSWLNLLFEEVHPAGRLLHKVARRQSSCRKLHRGSAFEIVGYNALMAFSIVGQFVACRQPVVVLAWRLQAGDLRKCQGDAAFLRASQPGAVPAFAVPVMRRMARRSRSASLAMAMSGSVANRSSRRACSWAPVRNGRASVAHACVMPACWASLGAPACAWRQSPAISRNGRSMRSDTDIGVRVSLPPWSGGSSCTAAPRQIRRATIRHIVPW
jgi:hypothetical protein